MISIRQAKSNEFKILTQVAIASEAYWGYENDYMETFKELYAVTEDFINNNPTFIIEKEENIIGFYSIFIEEKEVSLEYFFIEPNYIGKGYGKLLWKNMIENCKDFGVKEFVIVTSPQAKEFYTKMGAVKIGEVESLVKKGRKIPKLIYNCENYNCGK